jgi:hypothetical protein
MAEEPREHGFTRQFSALAAWLNGQPVAEQNLAEAPRQTTLSHPPRLPAICPFCVGSVNPRDVECGDAVTVECDFCRSLLRAVEG